ncbi:MAG: DUF3971 domain-containing protein [Pseudomonadota bacterium]
MRYWLRKIILLLLYTLACVIISVAIFGVALKEFTPVINKHKSVIEQYASSLLHAEVHIKSIEANWARFGPEVHFKGISLSEYHADKAFINADDLTMHIGVFRTIWRQSVYFRSLSLSGSEISIREITAQHYLINETFSVDLSDQTNSQLPEFLAWLVTQKHIRLNKIHVALQQLDKSAASLQFNAANVYLSDKDQSSKELAIFIDGKASGETVDSSHKTKLFKSDVTLSAWVHLFQQKLTFAEVELLNRNIVLQEENMQHHFPSFAGVFVWQPVKGSDGDNWVLQGKKVTLTKTSHEASDYSFELWRFSDHYAAHLNSLNLLDVTIIGDFFNLIPGYFNVEKAQVGGVIKDIDLIIPQDVSAINDYRFSAVLHNLSSVAYQEFPEMHSLSGAVSGSLSQGTFMLLDQNDTLYFPHYFDQPLSIKNLTANGQWQFADHTLSLLFSSMRANAVTAEAQGAMKLEIPFNSSASVMLSLIGQYHLKQSQEATKFLPMKQFDPDFAKWLTAAIGQGLGSEGKVLIRGAIDDFPYPKKEGVFIVDGSIKPMDVTFSPEWPTVKNIAGHLMLHNQAFNMKITSGVVADGVKISEASVSVPDYEADDSIVNVDLNAAGEIPNYLKYIQKTPLNKTLGQWLSPFNLTGPGALSLHLGLPIAHLDNDHIQVSGQWLAQSDSFSLKSLSNDIVKNIKGAIHFTQDSVFADHVNATLESEPLQFSINTEKQKGVMTAIGVDAQGAFSVSELKTLSQIDWLSFYLAGRSQFHAHLRVPMSAPEYLFSFDTDLRGIKINLPEDLGKETKSAVPFSAQISLNPTADIARLMLSYTKNMNAIVDVQHYSQEKIRTLQVDAHAVAFSWPLTIATPKTSTSDSPSLWQSLTALTVHVSHLALYKNDFSSVLISGVRNADNFLWKIQSNEAEGKVVLPFDAKQPINANFSYVTLKDEKKVTPPPVEVSTSDLSAKTAATWPPFYLEIERFKKGKLNWGHTIVQTTPITNGVKFDKIYLQNKYHNISAHGRWVNEGAKDTTYLEGEFATKNLGKFLSASDITQNFEAQEGAVTFNLRWLGSPMKFQLQTLEGDASIDVKNGVIPLSGDAAKNGLGKVLTLFSAQSIQRRLQLNFSDLGENGYSFNSLISVMHFQNGDAKVEKGAFDGPEAKIGFTGRLGLVKQDYDLYLVVTPYVTSSLPLIATLAGGPIAGVATYAFDKIAAGSIAKFTSYKYLLRGPWAKPQLISLDLEAEKKPEEKNIAPVTDAT